VQTKEQIEQLLSEMDDFVNPNKNPSGKPQPKLDYELMKIWNGGNHLEWEWSEKTPKEDAQREANEQIIQDKINEYKNNLELFKNEKIRLWRDWALVNWFDSLRSKPELWEDQSQEIKNEALAMRRELLDFPDKFINYVIDKTIESRKPAKPSYIME